jgi:hypothetical protein
MDATCTAPHCDRPVRARGLCPAHYERSRHGRPLEAPVGRYTPGGTTQVALRLPGPLAERLRALAALRGRSLTAEATAAIEAHLAKVA